MPAEIEANKLALLLLTMVFGYNRLQAICFDEEQATLRGLNVTAYYTVLLCIIACTVVLLVSVVGIILVVALLTIPAAMAGKSAGSLSGMMIRASLLTLLFVSLGISVSFMSDWPVGPTCGRIGLPPVKLIPEHQSLLIVQLAPWYIRTLLTGAIDCAHQCK